MDHLLNLSFIHFDWKVQRYCPDCATTTSSSITSSKLFFSITCINQRRGKYEVLVCFNWKANVCERESLGDNNFESYSACNSLNCYTFSQPRWLAFILWNNYITQKLIRNRQTWKNMRNFSSGSSIFWAGMFWSFNLWLSFARSNNKYSCCRHNSSMNMWKFSFAYTEETSEIDPWKLLYQYIETLDFNAYECD